MIRTKMGGAILLSSALMIGCPDPDDSPSPTQPAEPTASAGSTQAPATASMAATTTQATSPTASATPPPTREPSPTQTEEATPTGSTPTSTAPTPTIQDGTPGPTPTQGTATQPATQTPEPGTTPTDEPAENLAPTVQILSHSDGGALLADEPVTISARASDDGPAADMIVSARFNSVDVLVGGTPDSGGNFVFAVQGACGEHTITARAVDGEGAFGEAQIAVIANKPPAVAITPNGVSSVEQGVRFTLSGSVTDPCDDDLTTLAVALISDLDGAVAEGDVSSDGSWELSTIRLSAGSHALSVVATDPHGLSGEAQVNLEVLPYSCEDDFVAAFDFNEGAGVTAADSSEYGNNLSLSSGATWGLGPDEAYGACLSLDGSDDYAIGDDNESLDLDAAVTVETWLYLNAMPPGPRNWWTVVSKGTAAEIGTDRNYSLYVRDDGVLHWSHSRPDLGGQSLCQNSPEGLITAQEWIHIVVTASPAEGGTKAYYVNGELAFSDTGCGNTSLVTNDGPLLVGNTSEVNHYLNGSVEGLRIRPCAVTEGQAQEIYETAP